MSINTFEQLDEALNDLSSVASTLRILANSDEGSQVESALDLQAKIVERIVSNLDRSFWRELLSTVDDEERRPADLPDCSYPPVPTAAA